MPGCIVIAFGLFFARVLQTYAESVPAPLEENDLKISDDKLESFYLQQYLDEANKKLAECQSECVDIQQSLTQLKAEWETCDRDLKKFVALLAARTRILYLEGVLGKGWSSGAEEPKLDLTKNFDYHRDLWMWIFGRASESSRVVKLKKHVQSGGLTQKEFCESMARSLISTAFMHNVMITRLPRFTSKDISDTLKDLSLDEVALKALVIVMNDQFLTP